jgi:hypothetical protein
MSYRGKLSCLLTVLIFTACTVTKTICPCEAPEVIRLEDKAIEINAQIVLNDTIASAGMKVKILLTTLYHTALPVNLRADYYYLRSSNLARNAFEGKFTSLNTNLAEGIMELEADNAPGWGNGELVDIAVHLLDSRGKIHFLKKDAVPVRPAYR